LYISLVLVVWFSHVVYFTSCSCVFQPCCIFH